MPKIKRQPRMSGATGQQKPSRPRARRTERASKRGQRRRISLVRGPYAPHFMFLQETKRRGIWQGLSNPDCTHCQFAEAACAVHGRRVRAEEIIGTFSTRYEYWELLDEDTD